jgi:hypothetical protein
MLKNRYPFRETSIMFLSKWEEQLYQSQSKKDGAYFHHASGRFHHHPLILRNQNENVNTSGDDRSDSEDVISDNEVENPNRASVANRPTSIVTTPSIK